MIESKSLNKVIKDLKSGDLCSLVILAKRIPPNREKLIENLLVDELKDYTEICKNEECSREEILINAGIQTGINLVLNYTIYYFLYSILKKAKKQIIEECVSRATYYRILKRLKWLEEEEQLQSIRQCVDILLSLQSQKRQKQRMIVSNKEK